MKKLLFLIATTALLCSCDKITIEKEDIANTYWGKWSEYHEYIEDGKKVKVDTAKTPLDGGMGLSWHFNDNDELVEYVKPNHIPGFYHTTQYQVDLKKRTIVANTYYDDKPIVYRIQKFTDNELVVEYTNRVNDDYDALIGMRFRKIPMPSDEWLSQYTNYNDLPEEYK